MKLGRPDVTSSFAGKPLVVRQATPSPLIKCNQILHLLHQQINGPVRLSYDLYFLVCLFSRNSVFLPQQISWNSISSCFFSEANGAILWIAREQHVICLLILPAWKLKRLEFKAWEGLSPAASWKIVLEIDYTQLLWKARVGYNHSCAVECGYIAASIHQVQSNRYLK